MRILILAINFSPEPIGAGKYTGEMAAWLARRGHEVRVVTAPPHNPYWRVPPGFSSWTYSREEQLCGDFGPIDRQQLVKSSKIQVLRCPLWVPKNPYGIQRLFHLASFALSAWPAILAQIVWRPEIVFVVEPTLLCAIQALFIAKCLGAKAWLHIQDFELDAAFELGDLSSYRARNWALALERALLCRFDRVSAITERMVERLETKGVDRSRRLVFPNWVNTKLIYPLSGPSPLRRELGISENTIVLLYSGSMGKKQGLSLLAEAARRHSRSREVFYVFTGEGPYRQTLRELTNDLPNVIHLPLQPSERLNDLLNLADIHLIPQRPEAADLVMPSKLTGILASGRPVIVTAGRGTQLAAAVHGRGLVVPPGDLDAFMSAIASLSQSKELRLSLGQKAREYASSQLDLDVILLRFEKAMLGVCTALKGESQHKQSAGYVEPELERAHPIAGESSRGG